MNRVCIAKNCQEKIDKSTNDFLCKFHWRDYKHMIKDIPNEEVLRKGFEVVVQEYYEKVNPKWVWKDFFGRALKYAKEGNYRKGQDVILELLKSGRSIPDYPLRWAYEIIGDLCFFNEEFDRAISYYKTYWKQGEQNYVWIGNTDKILNARRLVGEKMAGDEIMMVSQTSYHVDSSIKSDDSLAGYTKKYKPTDFFKRNKDLVGRFAEEVALKWEEENKRKLLDLGGKDKEHTMITSHPNPCIFYARFTGDSDTVEVNGNTPWYNQLFDNFGFLSYHYSGDKTLREFIEAIVDIVYEAENLARDYMGIEKRGEGWVSETELYYKTKELFADFEVLHQARPKWLGKQHLDIYIPELNLAIEYQGMQHLKPIDFFGGERGFRETQKRDIRKKKLCEKNKVKLIYIYENEAKEEAYEKIQVLHKRSIS